METTIKNGSIVCKLYGDITAIDCDSLQSTHCESCFIYLALKDTPADLSEFDGIHSSKGYKDSKAIN